MEITDYDIECIEKAKALIDTDTSVHYSIEHIARTVGIGSTKLKKGFRGKYKSSVYAYLRKQRMIKAARLLRETQKTIKQVAKETGFHYIGNFTRAFTDYYKTAPGAYRIKKQKK
ncbi:helix-turn-helix domain-containing protein [Ferruginibacter sp.]